MADMNILDNGAASGGITGMLVVALKGLYEVWQGRRGNGPLTEKEVLTAIEKNNEKQDEKAKALAQEIKEKADAQDIKIALLEHQKSCIGEIRADTKEFQSQILLSFTHMTESNQESFRRVHQRIDDLKDSIKKG